MARLMAVANGNNTDSSTWGLIDSTSFLESESIATDLTTSYVASSAFTPGAITIDGIAVRIWSRVLSPSGTMSVELYNSTLGASVAGTEVTINVSDAPFDGWIFFKFSASVLLLVSTNYQVRAKTSASTQVVLLTSTGNNWSRILRTTTTQAPAAGDDRFVMGEWTAAGSTTTRAVTLDDTAATDYGAASTSQSNPALSISQGGEVKAGTSASTAYLHKISGNTTIYYGAILRLADTTTRMPTTSSLTWTNDVTANVGFGIDVRYGGYFYAGGALKTRWTTLTADAAAAATVITLADTTGWAAGDTLLFAPTGTTASQGETKVISTVDSSTQVTLTAGLTNAHTGTGDVAGEVGNLTSNVNIQGTSTSLGTFITFKDGSAVNLDNLAVRYYGSSTTHKRGVEFQNGNNNVNGATVNKCVFRDASSTSTVVGQTTAASSFYITNCICYGLNSTGTGLIISPSSSSALFDVSNNLVVGNGSSSTGMNFAAVTNASGTCTGNRLAGNNVGLNFAAPFLQDTVSNISGFKVHSNSIGFNGPNSTQNKTITSCDFVSNGTGATGWAGICNFVSCNFYGNSVAGVSLISSAASIFAIKMTSCNFRGRTSFAQPIGVSWNIAYALTGKAVFNSCNFGSTTAHTTADVSVVAIQGGTSIFNNCVFASTTEFTSTVYTFLDENASICIQRLDGTAGNHKTFIQQGIVTSDTTIYNVASPSTRIAPKSATIAAVTKLFPFRVPVNSGQACTPTVYVRESESGDGAAYNGARMKLYVAENYNLGITSDTLLDTATAASDGAWEALTGATAAVTDDGVLEFYLTCNGTTGWVNFDDFTATVA